MQIYPIFFVLIFAILDWVAVSKKWIKLEYIAKPATMLAMIGWLLVNSGLMSSMLWFTLGAVFCLAGDVFLMLSSRAFIFGLLAFLVGHIFYIVGLNNQAPYVHWIGIVAIVLIGFYLAWLYPQLARGLTEKGKQALLIPVLIYSLVISLMVYSAVMTWTRPGWPGVASLSVSIGAVLFYASDSILAWDRFVKSIPNGRLINMIAYHAGQLGIVLGAILAGLNT